MKLKLLLSIGVFSFLLSCKTHQDMEFSSNSLIKMNVKKAINSRIKNEINPSIVIGVIDSTGIDFYAQGTTGINGIKPDQYTNYEIASVTKVFTGLLLGEAVASEKMKLEDPISEYLPRNLRLNDTLSGINLKQLATHSAGLYRESKNLHSAGYNPSDPYAHYHEKLLFEELESNPVSYTPGEKFQYSNLGMSLLGYLVSKHNGSNYQKSIKKNVLKPLGMENTSTIMPGKNKAMGHVYDLQINNWNWNVLAGAGSLKSNIHDMLQFLAAQMGLKNTSLDKAIAISQKKHFIVNDGFSVGLGWGIRALENGDTLYRHNGQTDGYTSFIAFLKNAKKGVVVLTNSSNLGVDDLGMHQLTDAYELKDFKKSIATVVSNRLEENLNIDLIAFQETIDKNEWSTEFHELNFLGYAYLKRNENKKAIEVFTLNILLHPDSADGFDSLAEAYFEDGQLDKSLEYYEKVLAIDSNYQNAKMMIEKINKIL